MVAITMNGFGHFNADSKRDITDEIGRQLNQRSSDDEANLNNRISSEVARQLLPINSGLQGLSIDIGKIKDHLHIAKNEAPNAPGSLDAIKNLDDRQFADSLPDLHQLLHGHLADAGLAAGGRP